MFFCFLLLLGIPRKALFTAQELPISIESDPLLSGPPDDDLKLGGLAMWPTFSD